MATQPRHQPDKRNDDDDDDQPQRGKVVGDAPLVMPLAEPAGEPLVGAIGVDGEHIEDGERDPRTIAEEQRIRSAALEAGEDPEAALAEAYAGDTSRQKQRQVAPPPKHAPEPPKHESKPAPKR